MQWRLIVALAVAMVLIVFTFQNPATHQMQFMGWQTGHIPLPITILISALIGAAASLLLGIRQTRRMRQRIRNLETELDDLTTPPIAPDDDEED